MRFRFLSKPSYFVLNSSEFFGNENTVIAWGETYDVSTEKHVLSNEQITLQSTRSSSMSATLQTTRNDSSVMDISNMVPASIDAPTEKKTASFQPSIFRKATPYAEDQKENIMVHDDTEMELSLVMPPPTKAAPSKSIFASSLKPSLFNFASKKEVIETPSPAERTNGSDNMDISGIEPAISSSDHKTETVPTGKSRESAYTNFLQQNNLIAKSKNEKDGRRQTTNQRFDMNLDNSHIIESPIISQSSKPSSRTTINEPSEMSLEIKPKVQTRAKVSESPINMSIEMPMEKVEKRTTRRQTVNQAEDMETSKLVSPMVQQSHSTQKKASQPNSRRTITEPQDLSLDAAEQSHANARGNNTHMSIQYFPEESRSSRRQTTHQPQDMDMDIETSHLATSVVVQPKNRKTIHQSIDMTMDDFNNLTKVNHHSRIDDMSIQYLPVEKPSTRRQTSHKVQDISLDTPTTKSGVQYQDIHQLKDMSLDTIQLSHSPAMPPANSIRKKQAANRMTMNEVRDMSFDSNATGKSNAYSRNNRTILADMSMDLQSTEPYPQSRKSVICKSPSKNATKMFDQSSLEFTKAIDQNVSYHPFHSTKLVDNNCSRFTEMGFDVSPEESFVAEEKQKSPVSVPVPMKRSVQMFSRATNQTNHGICDLDMSETSPIPTSKKFNLNKTPYYIGLDKENDLLDTMRISDSSSLDLTNNSIEEKASLNPNRKATVAESGHATMLLHATIKDDSRMDAAHETLSEPIEISDDSIKSVQQEPVFLSAGTKRNTCFQEVSMAVEPKSRNDTIRMSMANQSLFQLSSMESPIQNEGSISEKLPSQAGAIKRLTMNTSMNDSNSNFGNTSNGAEESKQLTFIEDDEDEDQICNTKIDLAISFEGSIHDSVERKCESFGNQTHEFSRFSMHSTEASMLSDVVKPYIERLNEQPFDEPVPSLTQELTAFKKSHRLRYSNVFDGNDTGNTNRSENTSNDEPPSAGTSLAQVSQSSIMQRRSLNSSNGEANESSFLMKRPDKKLSEIKIDFSGYKKLAGLATITDVMNDFANRMDQIRRQDLERAEQRRKFAAGEIDSIDSLNNNDDELVSLNVEAPSWSFLYKNKIDSEL